MARESVEIVTAPVEEPVTLAEARLHLRVDATTDDALITQLVTAGRRWAEDYTRRALVTQTRRVWLRAFPEVHCGQAIVELPGGRVSAVASVKYTDTAGVLQTLDPAAYVLDSKSDDEIAELWPAYGTSWPATRDEPNAVQVQYTVGYGSAAAVPAQFKQAVLLHVGWHYDNRAVDPFGVTEGGTFEPTRKALEQSLASVRLFTFG